MTELTKTQRDRLRWLNEHAGDPAPIDVAVARAEQWLRLDRLARKAGER